ncbi:MAG: septal ring lytic transglycosylase RlpA family protein [Akkermansiaceae bacterium]
MLVRCLLAVPFILVISCSELAVEVPGPDANIVEPKPVSKPDFKFSKKRALATYYGIASWYSVETNFGTKTASGRPFRNNGYTAAHKTLPMGSKVRVTNLSNGRSEVLTITDRGPYIKGRMIDVSIGSGKRLGFYSKGLTRVKVEVLTRGNWKYRHP